VRSKKLRDVVKRLLKVKIKSDLFTIPLLNPSSLYVMIDREAVYLGEIYSSEEINSEVYLSLVCDDPSYTILVRNAFHSLPFLVKNENGVYCAEASVSIKDYQPVDTGGIWDLGILFSLVGKVVKI
jgi:hypothetical protein